MLLRQLARRPVADDGPEVAPAHGEVAEDPLDPLAGLGGARARGAEDLALHRIPGQRPCLSRDDVEPQIVLPGERDAVLDAAAAELHVLLGALDVRGLACRNAAHGKAEPALVVRIEVAGDDRRALRLAGPHDLLVLVERSLCHADHDRGELCLEEGERSARIHRVPVQPVAGGASAHVRVDHPGVLQGPVRGDVRLLEAEAVRAAALETERVAPVVEHRPRAARRDEEQDRAGRPVGIRARRERLAHVVRRVRRARGVRVGAVELPAAGDRLRHPGRSGDSGTAKVAVAEDLGLRPLLEQRRDLKRVSRGEAQTPGRRRAAPCDRAHRPQEDGKLELVAAVAPRHEHAVEARPQEFLVHLLRVVGALLGLGLPLDELRPKGFRARDDLLRGEAGLGRRDRPVGARHEPRSERRSCSVASRSTTRFSGSSSGSPETTTP